jgi:hypothetical protein
MLDNVHEHLSFAFLLISYSYGGLLQYHIVLAIVIFFRLITVITGTEKRLLLVCITLFWLQSGTSSTTKTTDKISCKKEYRTLHESDILKSSRVEIAQYHCTDIGLVNLPK